MKSVLVTGGTGFIGSAVVELLIKNNVTVYVMTKSKKALSPLRQEKINGAQCIYLDLKNVDSLLSTGIHIDTCYHFAWDGISGEALSDIDKQYNNIKYCYQLLKTVSLMGCKKFIGAGSFGQLELKNEKSLTDKERYYKCAKDACENFCKTIANDLKIDFIWPLITNCYGVGEESRRFVNTMINELLKGKDFSVSEGRQYYDFVYIDDVAEAFYLIGEYGKSGKRYVIGSGNAKRHREWIESVPGYLCSTGKLKFGQFMFDGIYMDKRSYDITDLVQDTGYKPKISFEQGIKMTAEYILENIKD